MSKHENSDSVDYDALAFEYVAGTLRGAERSSFELQMRQRTDLADLVGFWEEQLMAQHLTTPSRAPAADTWDKIVANIATEPRVDTSEPKPRGFLSFLNWPKFAMAFSLMWAVGLSMWVGFKSTESFAPNSDYLAVLTTEANEPILTALTASEGDVLWLQWEGEKGLIEPDTSIQLWAESKRDGQIRPLHVFEQDGIAEIKLDEAALRLIRDSKYLLLTREEEGGSAIDEPSELILAKGVCIRLHASAI